MRAGAFGAIPRASQRDDGFKVAGGWLLDILPSLAVVAAAVTISPHSWPVAMVHGASTFAVALPVTAATLCFLRAGRRDYGLAPILRRLGMTLIALSGYELAVRSSYVHPRSTSLWWGVATLWMTPTAVCLWVEVARAVGRSTRRETETRLLSPCASGS